MFSFWKSFISELFAVWVLKVLQIPADVHKLTQKSLQSAIITHSTHCTVWPLLPRSVLSLLFPLPSLPSPLPWHRSSVCPHITFAARHPSPRVAEEPKFFIHSHYLHKQSPTPFLWQSQLNLYGSFMYCLLTVPFCPPAIGLGPGYNEPGGMEADWRNAPQ